MSDNQTGIACLACGAPTTNGLALCDLDQMRASTALELLPIYFASLARWSPGKAGARPKPGSREPRPLSSGTGNDRVGMALDEACADIVGWARSLADDRTGGVLPASHGEASSVRVACYFLAEHLTSVATLEWAGAFVDALALHEERLRSLTEAVAPGWYAGECGQCHSHTFVVPGLTWVTCRVCGLTTYARDHLENVRAEAGGWVARPKALAEVIVAMVDSEMSVPKLTTRIRVWAHREALTPHQKHVRRGYRYDLDTERFVVCDEEFGPARYRLADVLRLVETRDATKVEDEQAAS